MSWLGERITLSPYMEEHMQATRATWQKCPSCGRKQLVRRDESKLCMACDPSLEQVQPGVFVSRTQA